MFKDLRAGFIRDEDVSKTVMDVERKVVETLMKVGPRYTEISRITGAPISTVRYILRNRLPKLGLTVRPVIDYDMLGLQEYYAELRFSAHPQQAAGLLDMLGESMYLTYYTHLLKEGKFVCVFTVPPKYESSFIEFLYKLEELGILESHKVEKIVYRGVLPFRADCFDFRKGVWLQNWENKDTDSPPLKLSTRSRTLRNLTSLDLKILAKLQLNVFLKIIELAAQLGVSRQTLKRHYEHIIKAIKLYAIAWMPVQNPELVSTPLMLSMDYDAETRRKTLKIPFTHMEILTESGNYIAMMFLPSLGLYKTIRYIGENIPSNWLDFPNMNYAAHFTVHHGLFWEKGGWIDAFEVGLEKILKLVKATSQA